MDEILSYYTSHSPITDPGPYASLYDGLPGDLPGLFATIQGVLLHRNACARSNSAWGAWPNSTPHP
jgi:hypothetical protein